MAEEIPWEIREDAYNLYVTDGLTYEQVAQRTGVSLSQLKRWGQAEGWAEAKKEYREALAGIRRDTVKLRAGLLKKALDSKEPQDVYAFAAIERVEASRKSGSVDHVPVSQEKLKSIQTPQDAVSALQEVVELKLNRLLASPEAMKLSEISELKKALEMIAGMQARINPEEKEDAKEGGLSDETADEIRRQILGIQ